MVSQSAYIHTLTTAFASTLDEIPQDMCRHFAGEYDSVLSRLTLTPERNYYSPDLRELDAVLTQSLSGITKRIEELTERIEGSVGSEEQIIGNFQLLHEIADDTGRIKLGGEDKIRVASLAAEHVRFQARRWMAEYPLIPSTDECLSLSPTQPRPQNAQRGFILCSRNTFATYGLSSCAPVRIGRPCSRKS
jgi:inhibitor of growth protein 3